MVWMLSGNSLQHPWQRWVWWNYRNSYKSSKKDKFAKPFCGAGLDTKITLWAGCCKDFFSHIWLLYFWKSQQRNGKVWREFQESLNISGYSENTLCCLCLKNFKLEVFTEANVCSSTLVVHVQDEKYQVEDIKECVTWEYDWKWWLACVLQVNDSEIQLIFLHPFGLSKSFVYTSLLDILLFLASRVVTKVDPETWK